MIPKKIHYCWFGGNPLPELALKCIESWKKYCPDYEITEWNESNYDIDSAPLYVRQAYEAKKWGFVPDYIRLELIYKYGGIYLDTDVEIIKSLDSLLEYKGFAGFEDKNHIALGLGFGAEKENRIIRSLMETYLNNPFLKTDGSPDLTPSPVLNTDVLIALGVEPNGKKQDIDGFVFLSSDYLCPKDNITGKISLSDNTYSIHHYDASWLDDEMLYIKKIRLMLAKHLPGKVAHILSYVIGFTKTRGLLKMPKGLFEFIRNKQSFNNEQSKKENI